MLVLYWTRTFMPIRSSRKTAQHAGMSASFEAYLKRAVTYHASAITVLWVVVLFFSLGLGLTLLVQSVRLDATERGQQFLAQRVAALEQEVIAIKGQIMATKGTETAPSSVPPTTKPPTSATASPSGTLTRGSLSPDGTKYAGYDDVTKGKLGIGVEVIGETRIRHVVLFNTKAETSGTGTGSEPMLSVRWLDNQTIEYDVLALKSGTWSKETRTVKIFF